MARVRTSGYQATQRLITVLLFVGVCALTFGFFWINSGGKIIGVSQDGYRVAVNVPKADNVVYFSDVMIAGVKIGKVQEMTELGDQARAVMELNESVAPLHEGATVQVRAKSLIQESFLEITDGTGAELPDGAELPVGSGSSTTQVFDVLASLDEPTTTALGSALRSSAMATEGTADSISAAVQGLGSLGREGQDALDALAAQSADLEQLAGNATVLLAALNTRDGQIAQLVTDSNTVSKVTADQAPRIEEFIRALPPVLDSAREASDDLKDLAGSLAPVAENFLEASDDLNGALDELGPTSRALRNILPDLDEALDKAPYTLQRVDGFADELRYIVPDAKPFLADLNPMLGYIEPYGKEIGAFLTNFGETLSTGDRNGKAISVHLILNEQSFKGYPVDSNVGPFDKFNPFPKPGSLNENPGAEWSGPYTRVQEEPTG